MSSAHSKTGAQAGFAVFHEFTAGPALLLVNLSFLLGNGCGQDTMPVFDVEPETFPLSCVLMT